MPQFTTRDGCTIVYRDTGPEGAEPLVMLHGWSQSQAMFDRLLPHLEEQLPGQRVVTYDARNHGESGRTEGGARIASLAADLRELLDHLGAERAHLLGHSMGCSVIWSLVDSHGTDRIRSLVLVDQPSVCVLLPWVRPEEATDVGAILDMAGADGFVRAVLGAEASEARRAFLVSMVRKEIPAADLEWMNTENLKLAMPFGGKLLLDHVMQDWRDVLPRIDVPTLVTGGHVSHVDATSQEWIARQIPGARFRAFTAEEGGAQFPFFEAPTHFAAVLADFLQGASV